MSKEGQVFKRADFPQMVDAAIKAIVEKMGEDIVVFDMRDFTPFVDFNVLATAGSAMQAKVLMSAVIVEVKKSGTKVRSIEGEPESGWVLIDFWDMVVHIFRPELRRYYNLDGLWADMPFLAVGDENGGK